MQNYELKERDYRNLRVQVMNIIAQCAKKKISRYTPKLGLQHNIHQQICVDGAAYMLFIINFASFSMLKSIFRPLCIVLRYIRRLFMCLFDHLLTNPVRKTLAILFHSMVVSAFVFLDSVH